MKILAVETATEACSAALLIDGEILERYRLAPREHTRLILPMIDSLLEESGIVLQNLDALAFGRGPGSFTGIRIAAGIIQGLALGTALPVVPVSTLASMAQLYPTRDEATTIFSALDARMGEVYWGVFHKNSNGRVNPITEEAVLFAKEVDFPIRDPGRYAGLGSGWAAYGEVLNERLHGHVQSIDSECFPRASAVALLGEEGYRKGLAVAPEGALPVYLRNTVTGRKGT
ncbi:MAG: tRNA (adenosine(37)-N6)-threonylcarbamoyltransferase complex dimerization subunit type 1 TsaB [Gammaproteobacteria bacterium]